jgi:hypothetical protein
MKSERPKSINFIGAFSSLVVKRKFCPNENNYVRKCGLVFYMT